MSTFRDWRTLPLLSIVCLNYVGLELGSVLGDEIKRPRRVVPRASIIAGVSTVILYLVATLSLQASVPAAEIGVIDGILQGVQAATAELQLPWLLPLIAVLMSLNAAGNSSAWLAGSARIPFVIGIDRYLPRAFGKVHPRFRTPHVSLVVQGFASSLFIVISAIGATVHDMYLVLLQTTVILQLIPYLYMFAGLIAIRRDPARFGSTEAYFRRSWIVYVAGAFGFVVSAGGLFLAFVPTAGVSDVWNYELKTILGALSFLVPAVLIFRIEARRRRLAEVVAPAIGAMTE
jgi:amino acid transporter